MQRATCTGLRIRSPSDARVIFHAVLLNVLPMVTRRLDSEERSLITPGTVYVWEERGPQAEITGVGIERWTDGIRWGPSRVREGFLFYHAKGDHQSLYSDSAYSLRDTTRAILIKQTYTVFVDTPRGQRKWHLKREVCEGKTRTHVHLRTGWSSTNRIYTLYPKTKDGKAVLAMERAEVPVLAWFQFTQ
ncbi:hypothetical protein MPER_09096 [Moniliophthora perniciosa FA553]|nr:hypothetical protein MPER_09096 [Moniliophthora perniciosa FA553]